MSNFRNSWQICLKTGCLLFLMAAQTCMPGALNVELIQEKVVVEPHEVLPSNARTGFHGDAEIRARNTGFMEVGWSVRAGYLFPKRLLIGGGLSPGVGGGYPLGYGLQMKIKAGGGEF
nr:hypothetical protein [Flavilitoribacter sp.]